MLPKVNGGSNGCSFLGKTVVPTAGAVPAAGLQQIQKVGAEAQEEQFLRTQEQRQKYGRGRGCHFQEMGHEDLCHHNLNIKSKHDLILQSMVSEIRCIFVTLYAVVSFQDYSQ